MMMRDGDEQQIDDDDDRTGHRTIQPRPGRARANLPGERSAAGVGPGLDLDQGDERQLAAPRTPTGPGRARGTTST